MKVVGMGRRARGVGGGGEMGLRACRCDGVCPTRRTCAPRMYSKMSDIRCKLCTIVCPEPWQWAWQFERWPKSPQLAEALPLPEEEELPLASTASLRCELLMQMVPLVSTKLSSVGAITTPPSHCISQRSTSLARIMILPSTATKSRNTMKRMKTLTRCQ